MQRTSHTTSRNSARLMSMRMFMEAMAMPWPGRGAFVMGENS